ncbi:hypothetical protein SAMN05660772_01570 [Pasteurella testudinis DSM 23072]|uniref:DUF2288 domain-containing protein n=1 Tax=Pasteurella testudinis DSM 23072 TaxID=1122938 RepID=A0A1W1VBB8_9PAST|nr:DUF2288 domain-containing protein [Pasteurella testudinis]SMB90615.1 hypothetical protein SAMN05660772_01570 [Pasteurella testudinis DSM 23072]SUB52842.1 Uncharacterized conserved small protein [Pasteurella testudinis]
MQTDNLDLNQQTAKIHWHELQPHFARGKVLYLDPSLDLIEVAQAMLQDNSAYIAELIERRQVYAVTAAQALQFYQYNQLMWAVVLAPWVLAQPVENATPAEQSARPLQ